MCGIIGAIAKQDIVAILAQGLQRLEYRGYDSAGIAIIDAAQQIERYRVLGKVEKLNRMLATKPLQGNIGLGHTRWATHGKPAVKNAHPLISNNEIALVHNGIIENHESLRNLLLAHGYLFTSETDTEVVAHLIHYHLTQTNNLLTATQLAVKQLEGNFAIVLMRRTEPERLLGLRRGSPLIIGVGDNAECFFASDQLALLSVAQKFIYLEDNDLAEITTQAITIYQNYIKPIKRAVHKVNLNKESADKGEFSHYMIKEIFEQPHAISASLLSRMSDKHVLANIFGKHSDALLAKVKNVHVVACGTSYHAGLVGRYWLEALAGVSCQVEIASEYRYRAPVIHDKTLYVTLSQSGETIDTLAAFRAAKDLNYLSTLAICNVLESSLVREAELMLLTHAGPEIGVASTKSFVTQLAALLLLTIIIGRFNKKISPAQEAAICTCLKKLPEQLAHVIDLHKAIEQMASMLIHKQHALFIGRGIQYPIALEGALKLKEISYIHAEAYAAGELKHGALALVDKHMPVIALAPSNELLEKMKSTLQEIHARGGKLIVFTDKNAEIKPLADLKIIELPYVEPVLQPFIYTVPLQLLAYYAAVQKGTAVDQPRNLAKSVTVE